MRELALQQIAFKGAEDLGLVVAQLGLNPVLRVEEHLAIRFPHAVVLHPRPPLGINGIRGNPWFLGSWDWPFEIQQTALHKKLHRGDRLLDAGGEHAGPHLHVDQVAVKEFVGIGQMVAVDQVGDQRIALEVS